MDHAPCPRFDHEWLAIAPLRGNKPVYNCCLVGEHIAVAVYFLGRCLGSCSINKENEMREMKTLNRVFQLSGLTSVLGYGMLMNAEALLVLIPKNLGAFLAGNKSRDHRRHPGRR